MAKFGVEWDRSAAVCLQCIDPDEILERVRAHGVVVLRDQSLDDHDLKEFARSLGSAMQPIRLRTPPLWLLEALSDTQRGYSASAEAAFLAKGHGEWGILLEGVKLAERGQDFFSSDNLYIGETSGVSSTYNVFNQIDIIESFGLDDQIKSDIWHSDVSYSPNPPSLGIFYACEVPEDGSGETFFCDMVSAVDSLSIKFQEFLSQCSAVHVADAHARRNGSYRGRLLKLPAMPPPVEHPIMCFDQKYGRSFLYANPFFTEKIVGLSFEESEHILEVIFAACLKPEFIYGHRWRKNDLVIFNNHETMHYAAKNISLNSYRKILRVMINGENPVPR